MRSRMPWLAAALTTIAVVSGCGADVETRTGACAVFRPIHPAPSDVETMSDGLVEALVAHNEKGKALCGWRPPGGPPDAGG